MNIKKLPFKRTLLLLASVSVVGCSGPGKSVETIAASAVDGLGCKLSQSQVWDSLHKVAEEAGDYPSALDVESSLRQLGALKGYSGSDFEAYISAFVTYYASTIEGIRKIYGPKSEAGWRKGLAEMEIGIESTSLHKQLKSEIAANLAALDAADSRLGATCQDPELDPPIAEGDPEETAQSEQEIDPGQGSEPLPEYSKKLEAETGSVWDELRRYPEVYGQQKIIATAYQSCSVLESRPMNASTPELQGVVQTGRHPSGAGWIREIGDLVKVNATHYYVHGQSLAKSSCTDVRKSPPIYDFGGKPYVSSSRPLELDLFKDAGSGGKGLGIDCSGYVFSALAVAGLKMDPDPKKPLKGNLVFGIGSGAFKEPQSNGLKCLAKVDVSKSAALSVGDVVAINGHVVMIDSVGADPYGLSRAKSVSDCNSSVLKSSGFDFVISQSSPSKGAVGINRYEAKDYLAGSSTYRDGLTRYAVAACRVKFGATAGLNSPSLSVVRHKKTPECVVAPLVAKHEDCIHSCRM